MKEANFARERPPKDGTHCQKYFFVFFNLQVSEFRVVQDIHQIIKEREVKTNLALPLSLAGTFSASVSAQAPGHNFLTGSADS